MNTARYMAISSVCVLLAGCMVPAGNADDVSENVSEDQSAFTEATCSSPTACQQNYSGNFCNQTYGIQSQLFYFSPDASYGSSVCSNAFVTQMTTSVEAVASAAWGDAKPTNATDCAESKTYIRVYNTTTGALIGSANNTAQWSSTSGTCSFAFTNDVTIPANVPVNILAQAYTGIWFPNIPLYWINYKKVKTTIY